MLVLTVYGMCISFVHLANNTRPRQLDAIQICRVGVCMCVCVSASVYRYIYILALAQGVAANLSNIGRALTRASMIC